VKNTIRVRASTDAPATLTLEAIDGITNMLASHVRWELGRRYRLQTEAMRLRDEDMAERIALAECTFGREVCI
jgi:hypothetical protein